MEAYLALVAQRRKGVSPSNQMKEGGRGAKTKPNPSLRHFYGLRFVWLRFYCGHESHDVRPFIFYIYLCASAMLEQQNHGGQFLQKASRLRARFSALFFVIIIIRIEGLLSFQQSHSVCIVCIESITKIHVLRSSCDNFPS